LSRFRFFALFATLAVLASVFAACGGGGSDSSNEDPQKVVEKASLEGVKSGEFEMSLHVNAEGQEGGEIDASLGGPKPAPKANSPRRKSASKPKAKLPAKTSTSRAV
jgi:hypothetical protein